MIIFKVCKNPLNGYTLFNYAFCYCVCVGVCARARVHTQLSPTLCNAMDEPSRLFRPWNFPGKNTGVGCHFLLQGIFPTQRSNFPVLGGGFFTTIPRGKRPPLV